MIQRLQTEGPVLVTNVTQLLCKQQTLNYLSKPDIGLDHNALMTQDYLQLQYLFFSIFRCDSISSVYPGMSVLIVEIWNDEMMELHLLTISGLVVLEVSSYGQQGRFG